MGQRSNMTAWHLVTGEYPPARGGVGDYTCAVAHALHAAGDPVHVWCPEAEEAAATDAQADVRVHRIAGGWSAADFDRIDAEMEQCSVERRLLLQWVPHAFGKRSLNVGFCRWIWRRAKSGDPLDVMVHEPGLGFREGTVRHDMAAAVHRLMLTTILREASRVWVAIPAWADVLRPWTLGRRDLPVEWLPVPSTIPISSDGGEVQRVRRARLSRSQTLLVGHFGTYEPAIRHALERLIPLLLEAAPEVHVELIGRGSEGFLHALRAGFVADVERVTAAGDLDATALSHRLQACDLVVQPYPDGASTRRTTLMAALAHGVPVATTIGRLSEPFWRESNAVAAAPASDVAALAAVAACLAREPERRHQLARAGRELYEARFGLSRVVEALRAKPCEAVC